jgi:hypothetical protein
LTVVLAFVLSVFCTQILWNEYASFLISLYMIAPNNISIYFDLSTRSHHFESFTIATMTVTNDHTFVVITIRFCPHSLHITVFVTRTTQRVPLVNNNLQNNTQKDRQSNGQSTKKTKGQEKFEKAKGTFRSRKLKKDNIIHMTVIYGF